MEKPLIIKRIPEKPANDEAVVAALKQNREYEMDKRSNSLDDRAGLEADEPGAPIPIPVF